MKMHCFLPLTKPSHAAGCVLAALIATSPALFATDMPVTAVQEALKREQFFYGESNGVLDEPTRAALRRFQIRYGLPVSGEIDAATTKALQDPSGREATAAPVAPVPASKTQAPANPTNEKDREFLQDLQHSDAARGKTPVTPPSAPMTAPAARSSVSETGEQNVTGTGTARIINRRGVIEDDTEAAPTRPPTPAPEAGETVRRVTRTTTTVTGATETDGDVDPLSPNGARIIRPPVPGSVPVPAGQARVIEERPMATPSATAAQRRDPSQGSGLPIYPQADEPPSRLVPEAPSRKPQSFFQRLFRGDR